jgi:hypothetical protein
MDLVLWGDVRSTGISELTGDVMTTKNGLTTVCPFCSVTAFFEAKTVQIQNSYTEVVEMTSTDDKGVQTAQDYSLDQNETAFISICPSCRKIVLVGEAMNEFTEGYEAFAYPHPTKQPDKELPREIRDALEEIYKCDSVGARLAVAVMARRFLEKCCATFGAHAGKLPSRIDELLRTKFPNETLLKRAHLVRCVGDEGAHAFGSVDWAEAKATVVFCEELAHHLFITEQQFEKIIAARTRIGKKVG